MCISKVFLRILLSFSPLNYLSYRFIYLYAPKSLLGKRLMYFIGCIQLHVTKKSLLLLYPKVHNTGLECQIYGFLMNPGSLYFVCAFILTHARQLLLHQEGRSRRTKDIMVESIFIFFLMSSFIVLMISLYLLELACKMASGKTFCECEFFFLDNFSQ